MGFTLTDAEWEHLAVLDNEIGHEQFVELAGELEIVAEANINGRALISRCVESIVERAREEGLPLSKYDRDALSELPPELLASIAALQGVRGAPSIDVVIKSGRRVYRRYQRHRPHSAVALLLPSLLTAVARANLLL